VRTREDTDEWFNSLSQIDVDSKVKYIFMPPFAFDRCDKLHRRLMRPEGNRNLIFPFFPAAFGRDLCSTKTMIKEILSQLRTCTVMMEHQPQAAFYELFACTHSMFMIDLWFVTTNTLDYSSDRAGNPLVTIADVLSKLWRRVLAPHACMAAGIDQENRDALLDFIRFINEHRWNPHLLNSLYPPNEAHLIKIRL
jgi:hypothetical protein